MKQKINLLLIIFAVANLFTFSVLKAQTVNSQIYTVEEIIEKAPGLVGQTVQVKGKAQHVCAQTGRKIFLATANGSKTFRVNAGKDIDKFDKNAVGKIVTITGIVFEQKVTLENLEKLEAQAIEAEKKQKEAEHCASEAKSEGQDVKASAVQRIQIQKTKLKEQIEKGGNAYLSYYSINNCNVYSIE
jgi:hypothetical protein